MQPGPAPKSGFWEGYVGLGLSVPIVALTPAVCAPWQDVTVVNQSNNLAEPSQPEVKLRKVSM